MKKIILLLIILSILLTGCLNAQQLATPQKNYTQLYNECSDQLNLATLDKEKLIASYRQLEQNNLDLTTKYNQEKGKKDNSTSCLSYILTIKRLEKQINESYILQECDNNTLKDNLTECRHKLIDYEEILDQTIEDLQEIIEQ